MVDKISATNPLEKISIKYRILKKHLHMHSKTRSSLEKNQLIDAYERGLAESKEASSMRVLLMKPGFFINLIAPYKGFWKNLFNANFLLAVLTGSFFSLLAFWINQSSGVSSSLDIDRLILSLKALWISAFTCLMLLIFKCMKCHWETRWAQEFYLIALLAVFLPFTLIPLSFSGIYSIGWGMLPPLMSVLIILSIHLSRTLSGYDFDSDIKVYTRRKLVKIANNESKERQKRADRIITGKIVEPLWMQRLHDRAQQATYKRISEKLNSQKGCMTTSCVVAHLYVIPNLALILGSLFMSMVPLNQELSPVISNIMNENDLQEIVYYPDHTTVSYQNKRETAILKSSEGWFNKCEDLNTYPLRITRRSDGIFVSSSISKPMSFMPFSDMIYQTQSLCIALSATVFSFDHETSANESGRVE